MSWGSENESVQRGEMYTAADIEALESEIERLKREREWISVEDRLPERAGMAVLVTAENTFGQKHVVKAFTDYTGRNGFQTNEKEYVLIWETAWKVTHWMPLPEPPKEDKQYGQAIRRTSGL